MKNKVKVIVDILMLLLFIILMGYHITDNQLHEIIGIIAFTLFIIHNLLNLHFYKNIFKGNRNYYRIIQLIVNLLLFIAMIGMMISGIIISSSVFSFLNIKTTMFGRNLHMISTSWGFVLMSIHVGLHFNVILLKLNKKMRNSILEYIYYFVILLLIVFGLYSFINNELWKDMFLVNMFKFFDYDQSPYWFYFDMFLIFSFFAFMTYLGLMLLKKIKSTK